MKLKVTNTEKNSALENLMVAAQPKGAGIYAQEKRGQQEFVNSEQMPRYLQGYEKISAVDTYQRLGFTFKFNDDGEALAGSTNDDIFIDVILPDGWTKSGSDHDMWSYVYDEQGRQRLAVFYKAAFYDRRADVSLIARFSYKTIYLYPAGKNQLNYHGDTNELPYVGVVMDRDKVIYQTGPSDTEDHSNPWAIELKKRNEAKIWLIKHFPDFEDPFAYWDQPLLMPKESQ